MALADQANNLHDPSVFRKGGILMQEREKAAIADLLSVRAFYSVWHFDLSSRIGRGELHDFYELVYVEKGLYHVLLDGDAYIVDPGSLIFFAPNTFHSGDGITKSDATVDILSFESDSPLMHCFDNRIFSLSDAERARLMELFSLAHRSFSPCKNGITVKGDADAVELQRLKKGLELLLLELYDGGERKPAPSGSKQYRKARFRTVSEYLKAHVGDPLTVDGIASACSVSVSGLKELCREFCGCGPIDYLISLRILAAKALIRESGMNFTEIAEKTGFASLHYFSRTFKARTGMTPSEYARMP